MTGRSGRSRRGGTGDVAPWPEVAVVITVAGGMGGLIYKAGQLTRALKELARRVKRIEDKLDRQQRRNVRLAADRELGRVADQAGDGDAYQVGQGQARLFGEFFELAACAGGDADGYLRGGLCDVCLHTAMICITLAVGKGGKHMNIQTALVTK